MVSISWKRVVITVCIIAVIPLLPAKRYMNKLAQPAPYRLNVPDPSLIKFSIQGTVFDPVGKQVSRVKVYLLLFEPPTRGGRIGNEFPNTISDDKGNFQFNNLLGYDSTYPDRIYHRLPEWNYQLLAYQPGFGYGVIHNILPVHNYFHADLHLVQEHQIKGTVFERDEHSGFKKPLEKALVSVGHYQLSFSNDTIFFRSYYNEDSSNLPPWAVLTNEKGEFVISGLPLAFNILLMVEKKGRFVWIENASETKNVKAIL